MFYYGVSRNNQYYKRFSKQSSICYRVGITKYSRKMIVDKCDIEIDNINCISISRLQNEKYTVTITDIVNAEHTLTFYPRHLKFYKFIPLLYVENIFDQLLDAFCENAKVTERDKKRLKGNKKKVLERKFYQEKQDVFVMDEIENQFNEFVQLMEFYSAILLSSRGQAIQDAADTYYIGPFRENPSRVYRDAERQVDSVGARGEEVSSMLKADFSHGKKVISGVSKWLEKAMNYKLTLKDIGSGLYNIVVILSL